VGYPREMWQKKKPMGKIEDIMIQICHAKSWERMIRHIYSVGSTPQGGKNKGNKKGLSQWGGSRNIPK